MRLGTGGRVSPDDGDWQGLIAVMEPALARLGFAYRASDLMEFAQRYAFAHPIVALRTPGEWATLFKKQCLGG